VKGTSLPTIPTEQFYNRQSPSGSSSYTVKGTSLPTIPTEQFYNRQSPSAALLTAINDERISYAAAASQDAW